MQNPGPHPYRTTVAKQTTRRTHQSPNYLQGTKSCTEEVTQAAAL